jgi:hypothetical protein
MFVSAGDAHDAARTRGSEGARSATRDVQGLASRIAPLQSLGALPCSAGQRGRNVTVHSCGEAHHASIVLARRRGRPAIRLAGAAAAGLRQPRPGVLAFGCVTTTRCGGSWVALYAFGACPPPRPIWAVLNLDTIGRRGELTPLPLRRYREREPRGLTRRSRSGLPPRWPLASTLLRLAHPSAAVWFERSRHPEVLAWGRRLAAARRYARSTRLPLRRVAPPTWASRFRRTSMFVVGFAPAREAGRTIYGGGVWDVDVRWKADGH